MRFNYVLYRFNINAPVKIGVFDTFYHATEYAEKHYIYDYVIEAERGVA